MDSLVANYASSDEEEEQQQHNSAAPSSKATKSSSPFLSLPKPKLPQQPSNPSSSSIQHEDDKEQGDPNPKTKSTHKSSSSLFTSLPQPKSQPLSVLSNSKRVVQFRPPILASSSSIKSTDLDDDDDYQKDKSRERISQSLAQSSSVKSFLSSIPAPKNSSVTLGAIPTSGPGRRSIIETDVPASISPNSAGADKVSGTHQNDGNFVDYGNYGQNAGNHVNYESYELGFDQNAGSYVNYDTYANHQSEPAITGNYYGGSYERNEGNYGNTWGDGLMPNTAPEIAGKKRGRNEVPTDIVEVKQDELIKNRPREDQAKLTGIAYGPSYQPVSTKGKPSKLHKRKHQIGSLFFDMKQKEMELSERRSRGFLTKAETQAKYGW